MIGISRLSLNQATVKNLTLAQAAQLCVRQPWPITARPSQRQRSWKPMR